jgi:glycosyltransferase involved in cell wall biosynthesis
MKKNILILTDVEFWKKGAGHQMRICALIEYLSIHSILSVVFIGVGSDIDEVAIGVEYECTLHFLEKKRNIDIKEYGRLLKEYLDSRSFDFCIVEYLHLSFYTQYLSENTTTILDTHDILYQRYLSFSAYNQESRTDDISQELEFQFFDMYDYIMLISEPDLNLLEHSFPGNKLLLCPHPSPIFTHSIRESVTNIGFIASEYLPNIDAINFFCEESWPQISAVFNVTLSIYGNIKRKLSLWEQSPGIDLKGFVQDLNEVYGAIDIAINPVRFGAGLKIKNIEALANGIPLVTTTLGARGLEKGINKAFFVADTPAETVACIKQLIQNPDLRRNMSECGKQFILEYYSPDVCFSELLNVINPGSI